MHFYAYHGCFEEEQIIGNKFLVNFWAEADLSKPAATDNIEDALNYQLVYNVIKEQMEIKSHLLEHVARRILDAIKSHLLEHVAMRILDAVKAQFPYIERAQVQISKLNPPLGGQVYASRVTMNL